MPEYWQVFALYEDKPYDPQYVASFMDYERAVLKRNYVQEFEPVIECWIEED